MTHPPAMTEIYLRQQRQTVAMTAEHHRVTSASRTQAHRHRWLTPALRRRPTTVAQPMPAAVS